MIPGRGLSGEVVTAAGAVGTALARGFNGFDARVGFDVGGMGAMGTTDTSGTGASTGAVFSGNASLRVASTGTVDCACTGNALDAGTAVSLASPRRT
jgi:hypothetical protein